VTTLQVDDELRLRAAAKDPWDGSETAERYVIERLHDTTWHPVGTAVLGPDDLDVTVHEPHRRQAVARRVVLRLADRARVLGWTELRVREVVDGQDASHALVRGLGFVARGDGPPAYVLRLAPVGGRPRL
jgi:GNAT superfamily N-acetyltransferase